MIVMMMMMMMMMMMIKCNKLIYMLCLFSLV